MLHVPQIYKFDPYGGFISTLGGTGKTALIRPACILIHHEHIYVADYGGKRIIKMTMAGEFVQDFTTKGEYEPMIGPACVHLDNDDNLYILDLGEVPVVQLSPEGALISKIGAFGSDKGQFLYPRGIVAFNSGQIYILDNSRNVILSFKKNQ